MSFAFQLPTQLGEVVDFSVEDDPDAAIFVGDRLVARHEVNDVEASHRETHVLVHKEAFIVRATVRERVGHSLELFGLDRPGAVVINYAGYSAHRLFDGHPQD